MHDGKRTLIAFVALHLSVGCRGSSASSPWKDAGDDAHTPVRALAREDEPEPPVFAQTIAVTGDVPVFYVKGHHGKGERMVFFHGACTHGLGYIQAFQFAASERGSLMALQGEHDCGHGYRSWAWDLDRTNARVDAGFRAAGDDANDRPVTAIGYSQGALIAEALAAKYPAKYRRLILIGSPRLVNARSLSALQGAVFMAGTFDNRSIMKDGRAALERVGVPATFIEIPNARHGQLLDGEKVMNEALAWLERYAKKPSEDTNASSGAALAKDAGENLEPLANAAWLESLDLGDGDSAVVSVPLGATEPRPLMLAVHGAGDRPEWACGGWRLGNDAYPFIVCPRGAAISATTYAWSSWQQLERVSLKALDSVRRRFGGYVAPGPMTYAGFSQGATAAEPLLVKHASDFRLVILAEGAYASTKSPPFARALQRGGTRTVVLVCGTRHCFDEAAEATPVLEREGLKVFVGGDASSGHNLNLPMQRALRRSWKGWFIDEPTWADFEAK